jgi:hypothetical protein
LQLALDLISKAQNLDFGEKRPKNAFLALFSSFETPVKMAFLDIQQVARTQKWGDGPKITKVRFIYDKNHKNDQKWSFSKNRHFLTIFDLSSTFEIGSSPGHAHKFHSLKNGTSHFNLLHLHTFCTYTDLLCGIEILRSFLSKMDQNLTIF